MLPYGQPVANGSAPTAQVPGQMQEHLQINAYGNDARSAVTNSQYQERIMK